MDMHSPWPGQDGDDSDHHRASMGMGRDVDHGFDTRSYQKRQKCSMPETTCTGVDPGNWAGLMHKRVKRHMLWHR